MAEAEGEQVYGTIVHTSDGEVYFISEEVLAGCRVTDEKAKSDLGEQLDEFAAELKPEFKLAYGSVSRPALVRGPAIAQPRFQLIADRQFSFDRVAAW